MPAVSGELQRLFKEPARKQNGYVVKKLSETLGISKEEFKKEIEQWLTPFTGYQGRTFHGISGEDLYNETKSFFNNQGFTDAEGVFTPKGLQRLKDEFINKDKSTALQWAHKNALSLADKANPFRIHGRGLGLLTYANPNRAAGAAEDMFTWIKNDMPNGPEKEGYLKAIERFTGNPFN